MADRRTVPRTPRAKRKIRTTLDEFKAGTLRSGKVGPGKGPRVQSRKQAIAIALSQARRMKG